MEGGRAAGPVMAGRERLALVVSKLFLDRIYERNVVYTS
jgi:hypothetical protein